MRIVDAQVHIWSAGKPTNPRHRQVPAFTKDELLGEMREAGVDAAVIHPVTSWDPNANALAIEQRVFIRIASRSSVASPSRGRRAAR